MPYADYQQHLKRNRERAKTPEGKAAGLRANREWRRRNRQKVAAHNAVARAIAAGSISRQPCERCGNQNSQAHHDDYSKPLEIRWLCDVDHKERHRELKASAQ